MEEFATELVEALDDSAAAAWAAALAFARLFGSLT